MVVGGLRLWKGLAVTFVSGGWVENPGEERIRKVHHQKMQTSGRVATYPENTSKALGSAFNRWTPS
jgi:hypothetical protein